MEEIKSSTNNSKKKVDKLLLDKVNMTELSMNLSKLRLISEIEQNKISEALKPIQNFYSEFYEKTSLFLEAYNIQFEGLFGQFQKLGKGFELYKNNIINASKLLADIHWFPGLFLGSYFLSNDVSEAVDFSQEIIESKDCVRDDSNNIDDIIFEYFSQDTLDEVMSVWDNMIDLQDYQKRMLKEAIDGYSHGKFAVTVTMLVCMFEPLLSIKMNVTHIIDQKKAFSKLISECDFKDFIDVSIFEQTHEYYYNYVMYSCDSPKKIKKDSPGRNAIVHGWINEYPTRKAALNAILLTDFILGLDHLKNET